jgi:hypothetical protein
MELLRIWSHRAEKMKKVWKQRGETYGVLEGRVINTRFGGFVGSEFSGAGASTLLVLHQLSYKNHAHWSLMPA